MTAGKRRELRALEEDLEDISRSEPVQLAGGGAPAQRDCRTAGWKSSGCRLSTPFDLRYKNYEKRPEPSSQAVMFCLMDVSGSMDQATKDTARRFYILPYLFLSRTYKNVDVVYIRHHTQAKEVMSTNSSILRKPAAPSGSSALEADGWQVR